MQHDAWFFLGIFVFIFLIWVATGGPTHPIAFAGPTLSAPAPIGGGSYIRLPQAPFTIGHSNVQLANPLDNTGYSYSPGTTGLNNLSGVSFGPPSPYRGQMTLSHYVSGAGGTNPANEYVTVSLASNASGPVTLTDWSLESDASGAAATIPSGTEVPMSGVIQALQPIVLEPGDKAIIDSGASPIGASFRENKCVGYFGEFQTFSPSLSNSCPLPYDELQQFYGPDYIRDSACIDYVKKLPACTVSITAPPGMSTSCSNFLSHYLNYNGCEVAHQNDPNFKGHTWRVYLSRGVSMWRKSNEVVKLIDNNGRTVDAFTY